MVEWRCLLPNHSSGHPLANMNAHSFSPPSDMEQLRLDAALQVAANGRDLAEVCRLVALGAKGVAPAGDRAPLSVATQRKNLDLMEALLPASDANETDEIANSHITPLSLAAGAGFAKGVKLLLAHGADPLRKNAMGRTPLMFAALASSASCVRALLPVSDPLVQDATGTTALMLATQAATSKAKIRILELLAPVSDPRAKNSLGGTALMIAALGGNTRAARILVDGSDAQAQDARGKSADDHARAVGHIDLAEELFAHKERQAMLQELAQRAAPPAEKIARKKKPRSL